MKNLRAYILGGLLLLVGGKEATGQNLVMNPGFEQYIYCVDSTSNTTRPGYRGALTTYPNYLINNQLAGGTWAPGWISPTPIGTTHILHCNVSIVIRALGRRYTGWYNPRNGAGYLVLNTYATGGISSIPDPIRNYAQGQLTRPLQAGCTYRVSCWLRAARTLEGILSPPPAPGASDNLGVYFSVARIGLTATAQFAGLQPQALLLPPGQFVTDTLKYVYLSRTFVAQGGEQYFTVGNFQPNAATAVRQLRPTTFPPAAYYALDDVSVEAVPPPGLTLELGPDQWLGACPGAGPATLTAPPGFQGYRWSTGQTTASIQVSQPGRYVVTADFGCGTLRDSVELRRYNPRLTPLLTPPPALCPGQPLTLTAAPGFRDYQWADGLTGPSRLVSRPGRYRLLAHTADGCPVRDSVDVVELPQPAIPAAFPADTLVCAQQALRLTLPAPPPGVSYTWSTGATGPVLYVPAGAAGTYTLTAATRCQSITATVRVRAQDCAPLLTIPTIVTANGDHRNDRFRVLAPSPRTLRLQVFSRWGQLVFESGNYRDQWPTGPEVAAGLYYYLLQDDTYGRRYRGWIEVVR